MIGQFCGPYFRLTSFSSPYCKLRILVFSCRFMARSLRAWAISEWEKNSVRNLQCGPRTQLVRVTYRTSSCYQPGGRTVGLFFVLFCFVLFFLLHITSHDTIPHHNDHIPSRYNTSHHITSLQLTPPHITSHHGTSHITHQEASEILPSYNISFILCFLPRISGKSTCKLSNYV